MKKQGKRRLFLILLSFLFLASCRPRWEFLPLDDKVIAGSFPDRDIVFQLDQYYSGGSDKVGFVNADGSGETYLHINNVAAVVKPMWVDDGSLLVFHHPVHFFEGITQEGIRIDFKGIWALEASLIHGKNEILLISSHEGSYVIKKVHLDSRKVLEIYQTCKFGTVTKYSPPFLRKFFTHIYAEKISVTPAYEGVLSGIKRLFWGGEYFMTLTKFQIDDPDDTLEGISLGTNNLYNQQLLYIRWWVDENDVVHEELVILNTDTNEHRILLEYSGDEQTVTHIMSPAFSPDGQWIAYTASDGIYLIRPDESMNQQVIKYKVVNFHEWPPVVSWSPDGKWIIYHRCMLENKEKCRNNVEDSTIFKYNIETGEEVPLVEGGVNPYWRWREESP